MFAENSVDVIRINIQGSMPVRRGKGQLLVNKAFVFLRTKNYGFVGGV